MPDADEVNPRIEGALKKLLEITDRLKTGELMIGDFFINASSTDPCRMNIEMKIIRGPTQGVTDPSATAAPVTYAMADEPKLRALIERERQAAIKEERRRQEARQTGASRGRPQTQYIQDENGYWWDEGGNMMPFGWRPNSQQLTVPRPPVARREKPVLANGARILDLDD